MRQQVSLATLGAPPAFHKPLRVGQGNLPDWPRLEHSLRSIFERRYFANGGPLVRELDATFAKVLGANHSVSVTNESVALMILLKSLEISGEVIVPALASPAVPQALWWAGLTPVVCDVDTETFMLSPETVSQKISANTAGILGVRVFGCGDNSEELEELAADRGLKLVFDASSAIMCATRGRRLGTFGSGEAFSFHSAELVNAAEGGSIVTNDDILAGKLKTIRNFYVPAQRVQLRINGKMAEAPAALALLGIEDLYDLITSNRHRHARFADQLQGITGVSLIQFNDRDENNYQSVVLRVDPSTARINIGDLMEALAAENVFSARPFGWGIHRQRNAGVVTGPLQDSCPNADSLCQQLIQLPSGQSIDLPDVDRICDVIREICAKAEEVKAGLQAAR